MGEKITIKDGILNVPGFPGDPFYRGDVPDRDIWNASVRVFDAAVETHTGEAKIIWKEVLAGEEGIQPTGNWLPDETLAAIREYIVAIKGPLTTPVGGGSVP